MTESRADSITVQDLLEAVTAGVVRAVSAQHEAATSPVRHQLMNSLAKGGLFGSVVISAGQWPTGDGNVLGSLGIPSLPGAAKNIGEQSGG